MKKVISPNCGGIPMAYIKKYGCPQPKNDILCKSCELNGKDKNKRFRNGRMDK